jgi:glycerophosphoryl diester phosphodiesterase
MELKISGIYSEPVSVALRKNDGSLSQEVEKRVAAMDNGDARIIEALRLRWCENHHVEQPLTRTVISTHAVIAHRGAAYDAPESTAASYLLARDLGVDYLELDLQRTEDGKLVAFHDDDLRRTTNIAEVFPKRARDPINTFKLSELQQLDAGTWFNRKYPGRARPSFAGLPILTLDEVIGIAEGGTNRPGLYIETKRPELFPHIEEDLKRKLQEHRWIAYDLRLMSPLESEGGIPTAGNNLIVVAAVKNVLHFRIFGGDGKMAVDTDEATLKPQAVPIEGLRKQLASLWPPHKLTDEESARVISAITSIVGHPLGDASPAFTGSGGGWIRVGETSARVVMQSYEISSLKLLHSLMPQVPKILLLWLGDPYMKPRWPESYEGGPGGDIASFYARQEVKCVSEFDRWLKAASELGAVGVGAPARLIRGGEESYMDLVETWMNHRAHKKGLLVHAYTVDEREDFAALCDRGVDGFFTNRPEELLNHYGRRPKDSKAEIFKRYNY